MNDATNDTRTASVAILAMVLAVAAAVWFGAASPASATRQSAAMTATPWLHEIESGADHIDAPTLAAELMAARGDVVLVDVRPADEYRRYHLPGAVNLTLPEVCGSAGADLLAQRPRLLVLYSNGPAHPGQAWIELRRRGHTNVRVLDGGLDAFVQQILVPPSLRPLASEAGSKATAAAFARQRAFFTAGTTSAQPKPATGR